MGVKIGNFVSTTLANSTNASQTTMVVSSVSGFPSITTPGTDYFRLTIVRASDNAKEIVKVTDVTGTTITVERAEESTVGLAFAAGDAVGLRLTRQTILDLISELSTVYAAYNLLEANYTALSIPAAALKDDILALRHIPAGLITGAKLNAAVAGDGLGQDGSSNLKVNVDDSTIQISADALQLKAGGIVASHLSAGKFIAFVSVAAGSTSAGIVYEGTRPHAGIHGDSSSGARFVAMTIGNSHATEDLIIGIRIGSTLSYYDSTGSDTGVSVYTGVRIKNTGFFVAGTNYMTFGFLVPAGYRWMVENENGTTGTPVIASHQYWEFR